MHIVIKITNLTIESYHIQILNAVALDECILSYLFYNSKRTTDEYINFVNILRRI